MRPSSIDHLKPPIPYVKGWKFIAQSHAPPPPTIHFPACCVNDDAGNLEREQLHPVERCLLHPPLPRSNGTSRLELEICETLRAGDNHNAQLVIANVLETNLGLNGLTNGKRVVAKFYDPLYFFDDDGYLNPFLCMDKNYTHETVAYAALSDLQGSQIPEYHGSFTLNIPAGESKTRCVRLILIEFIPGKTMRDIDPKGVTRADRQNILKTVVDFETLLYTRNLVLADNHPGNAILSNSCGSLTELGLSLSILVMSCSAVQDIPATNPN